MGRRPHIDFDEARHQLERQLLLGPLSASELAARLGVSRPTVSRVIALLGPAILPIGEARRRRYVLRRAIDGLAAQAHPVFEVAADGTVSELGELAATWPSGTFLMRSAAAKSTLYDDLPWLFFGMRPSGFLGRLIPARQPSLQVPSDVRLWSGTHCLRYLVEHGSDAPGNLIVGAVAFDAYMRYRAAVVTGESWPGDVAEADRAGAYVELASDVLTAQIPGSSAAGEQPKFLATVVGGADRARRPVLVKFSPPVQTGPVAERVADLLIAEHLALETLRTGGVDAAQSAIVSAGGRVFLEVTRFDRTDEGRRGVLPLLAIDAEFVGGTGDWIATTSALRDLQLIDAESARTSATLSAFGKLIANTDMHAGNLSFFVEGARIGSITPAYDMLPMAYAPRAGELIDTHFSPTPPTTQTRKVWAHACSLAEAFWQQVATDSRISASFRSIAEANALQVSLLASISA